jgi:imidazolonepropionase-like amidohydrolase
MACQMRRRINRKMSLQMSCQVVRQMIIALGLVVFAAALGAQPAPAQTRLFEGARVIPGDGSAAIDNAAILVENGRITRVGPRADIAVPAGATRVDLSAKTVMPAIIATHVHPGFQAGTSYVAENYKRENVIDDLNRALYFGISIAMSQGVERGELLHQIRAEQADGRLGGARLMLAGRGIGAPNAGPGNPVYANFAYSLNTEADGRRAVQEQVARKVDAIKFWVDDRGGRAPKLSIPVSRVIIDETHKHGLRVAAHIFYHDDAVALAAAGVDLFAHLVRDKVMDDELIGLMVKNNVYVNPNISSPERGTHSSIPPWLDEPYLAGLLRDTVAPEVIERIRKSHANRDPAVAERNRRNYEILQRSVARLAAAGAKIVLGSDTGLEDHFFGYAEQREMELMVTAGMTPMQVIIAATSRGAEYLKLSDTGVLAPGKRADLLVLDANPLDDIKNTRRIARMYLNGVEVDRAALKTSLSSGR